MNAETERIEVLLALADAFAGVEADAREELLSTLGEETRHAVRRRGEWLDRLTPEKRRDWLRHTLARAQPSKRGAPPLDEHLHHSHVAEALRGEPERVRRLVVSHLPRVQAHRDRLDPSGRARFIDLVADPRVGHGGCVIEGESGTVDARLDTQLRVLERALLARASN